MHTPGTPLIMFRPVDTAGYAKPQSVSDPRSGSSTAGPASV